LRHATPAAQQDRPHGVRPAGQETWHVPVGTSQTWPLAQHTVPQTLLLGQQTPPAQLSPLAQQRLPQA
jgi:hypothetical protein